MELCWTADHRNGLFLERSPPSERRKRSSSFSLRVQVICGEEVWFATWALWCLHWPGRGGDLIIEGVLGAKKRLFEIQVVHKEQIESHHGQEGEDGQAGAEGSPRAADVQADPVNKSVEDERNQKRRSDQTRRSLWRFYQTSLSRTNEASLTNLQEILEMRNLVEINMYNNNLDSAWAAL